MCGAFIGAPGFEPGTSPTRTVRATRLRHAPNGPSIPQATGSPAFRRPSALAGVAADAPWPREPFHRPLPSSCGPRCRRRRRRRPPRSTVNARSLSARCGLGRCRRSRVCGLRGPSTSRRNGRAAPGRAVPRLVEGDERVDEHGVALAVDQRRAHRRPHRLVAGHLRGRSCRRPHRRDMNVDVQVAGCRHALKPFGSRPRRHHANVGALMSSRSGPSAMPLELVRPLPEGRAVVVLGRGRR